MLGADGLVEQVQEERGIVITGRGHLGAAQVLDVVGETVIERVHVSD